MIIESSWETKTLVNQLLFGIIRRINYGLTLYGKAMIHIISQLLPSAQPISFTAMKIISTELPAAVSCYRVSKRYSYKRYQR